MTTLTVPPRVRAVTWERDRGRCLRCCRSLTGARSLHHRFSRSMGGSRDPRLNDPRNLVWLCGSGITGCHGWVESHRTEATELGWLLASIVDVDTSLRNMFGQSFALTPDGKITPDPYLTPDRI